MTPFRQAVFAVVKQIPSGSTMTYGEVAAKAGYPGAARAVGSALKTNFDPAIPCHRVIPATGGIGEYNRGVAEKRTRLKAEGAPIADVV